MAKQIFYTFNASAWPADPTPSDSEYTSPIPYVEGYYKSIVKDGSNYSEITTKYYIPWTPSNIITSLWLDASDLSTIVKDGSNLVSQWNDKSGNNINCTATGTQRPTSTSNKLVFNGSSNLLTSVSVFQLTDSFSIFAVITGDAIAINQERGIFSIGMYNTGYWFERSSWSSNLNTYIKNGHHETPNSSLPSVAFLEKIVSHIRFINNSSSLYINSELLSEVSAGGVVDNTSPTTFNYKIGITDLCYSGTINELIIVPLNVNTDIRNKIEGYLAWKWDALNGNNNMVTNLPQSHPYKIGQPMS